MEASEDGVKQEVTNNDIYNLINDFRREIKEGYVEKNEFLPVKNIVYGMVGLVLTSVAVAIVAQVVKAIQ